MYAALVYKHLFLYLQESCLSSSLSFPPSLPPSQGAVGYQLPGTGITWSSIFRQIESNKERLGIVDYSVSQTTLDQVRKYFRGG